MNWTKLNDEAQLNEIIERSHSKPQVIFKHSTRCSISSMVLSRLERNGKPVSADFHFLDLIAHRNLSNKVADIFDVWHESPQILVVRNGQCVYDESHMAISMQDIENAAAA